MYDELVKRLRELQTITEHCNEQSCDECENRELCDKHDNKTLSGTYNEAADAIEELQRLVEANKTSNWIPVTERLPNGEAERYLVAAPLMALGLRVSICYYADNLEEVNEYDFKDEKRGGFYGYDDEYGYYEKSGVQYWMPLPTPPTAEEGEN